MISDVVNSVINNLADRLDEVVVALSPVVESANAIAHTVVQETMNVGMGYTAMGCGLIGVAVLMVICIIWVVNYVKEKGIREMTLTVLIILSIVIGFIGVVVILANLQDWLAPTKSVIRELVQAL